jgi:hypothetical protein
MQDATSWTDNPAFKWQQRGRIYLWQYTENTRNFPGWHLVVDSSARDSLVALVVSLNEAQDPVHRTLEINRPTHNVLCIPNNKDGLARFSAPTKLVIHFDPTSEDLWALDCVDDAAEWRLGANSMTELGAALADPNEFFDRTFGRDKQLWFWGLADDA